jgi:hypothetical protein
LCGRACSGSPWAQWIARRGGSGWGRAPCTHPARWLRLFGPHALAGLGLPVEPRSGAFGCGPDMRPADHGVAIVRIRRVLGRVDALVVWPRRRPGPGWPAGGGRGSSCRSGCGCRGRRLRLRRPARPGRRPGAGPQRGGRRHWSGGPAAPGRPPGSGRPRAPGARPGRTMPPRGGQPHPPALVAAVGSGLGAVGSATSRSGARTRRRWGGSSLRQDRVGLGREVGGEVVGAGGQHLGGAPARSPRWSRPGRFRSEDQLGRCGPGRRRCRVPWAAGPGASGGGGGVPWSGPAAPRVSRGARSASPGLPGAPPAPAGPGPVRPSRRRAAHQPRGQPAPGARPPPPQSVGPVGRMGVRVHDGNRSTPTPTQATKPKLWITLPSPTSQIQHQMEAPLPLSWERCSSTPVRSSATLMPGECMGRRGRAPSQATGRARGPSCRVRRVHGHRTPAPNQARA